MQHVTIVTAYQQGQQAAQAHLPEQKSTPRPRCPYEFGAARSDWLAGFNREQDDAFEIWWAFHMSVESWLDKVHGTKNP